MRALLFVLAACGAPALEHPHEAPPAAEHHHGGMQHRFQNADEWAKVFDAPDRDAWQKPDDVIRALSLAPGMTVADVGAGTGYFTVRLARAVPQGSVIATDIEPDMVAYLEHRAQREQLTNVHALLAKPDDPALPLASVDRVLIVDVWHHVGDRTAYAAKLADALEPGGQIAIVDFTMAATHGPSAKHRLLPAEVIQELEGAGLAATVSPVTLPEQYIVIATRR